MRFWYLLGVFSKISDEHPRHFHTGVPPWACNRPISSIAAYYQPVFSVTTEVDKKKKTFTRYLSIVEL